jgi:FkbM family methyltransferase
MKYYSQFGQDKWLNENIFKDKQDGFFLEIGADDGIDKSNTKLFEEKGWRGICIEPSPLRFKLLQKNRSCFVENLAISDEEGVADFLDIQGYGKGLSGIISNYPFQHKERLEIELSNPKNEGSNIIKIPTIKLGSVLVKYSVNHIDFLSIDTEGCEEKIIKSLDLSIFSIKVILIENNYKNTEIENHLKKQSYTKIKSFDVDDLYMKDSD